MTLAFRLYGNFRWPPAPHSVESESRTGVVDVFYLPDGDRLRAAIRWSPGEVIPGLVFPDKVDPEIVKPGDAIAFLNDGNVGKVFWIDAQAENDWLAFRGAFLLEQYPDAGPRLRLPLVNNIDYTAPESGKIFSGLRVLKGKQLELRINLPLPVEQSKASSTRAFPIAARYNTSTKVVPLSIQAFYGGWQAETTNGGTRIELKEHSAIETFQLGAFGVSERGKQPANFLSYRDHTASIGEYWPENASRFAEDLLGHYGFEVGRDSWLKYGESGPDDISLRFEPSGEIISSLTYRIRVIRRGSQTPGNGSELALDGDIFKLKLSDELGGEATTNDQAHYAVKKVGGWLRLGKEISADCRVSWQISDDVIWSNNPGHDWSATVSLRLHWAETIEAITAAPVDAATLFGGGLLKHANFTFGTARDAMAAGETGQPHAFVPMLSYEETNKSFRFALYGSPLRANVDGDGILSWGRPRNADGSFSGPWKRSPMRLSLASPDELIKTAGEAGDLLTLTTTAGGMSFFRESTAAFTLELSHDAGWPPTSISDVEDSEPFFSSFATRVTGTPAKEWHGRLASLEFRGKGALHNPPNKEELRGHLRIGGKGARDGLAPGGPAILYPRGRVATEFRFTMPVSAIEPTTVDVDRFDRSGRSAPLLIPLEEREGTGADEGRYWLRVTETLPMRQDRRLTADIIENSDEAAPRSFVVLASEPFSIFRFTHQPFSGRGNAESASVAVYSGDNRVWQYRKVSQYYHYVLPPQSVGESADKPRRLEIHDLPPSNDQDGVPFEPVDIIPPDSAENPPEFTENPPRPFRATFKKDGTLDEVLSNMQRRAVEQRLTPAAEIWIAPSDVERGYFMPEASSYEIFRQAGAYGLGAALAFLRAEFLYGLPVGIDVSKEGGNARGARVAEIEALVGRLAGGARETDADRNLASRWDALRAAVARRPERLEIWARDLGSTIDFAPARFSDGVRFALRGTALLRTPLLDQTVDASVNAEDPWTWPKVGVAMPDYSSAEATSAPAKPRHHPQGLSGGALWPVESLNLFNIMLEQPASSGGTIEHIALSPVGGDAVQKAEFLGGQVAIISETRNGRVQRQQVEVIGRICALWHRAKHVVVYERTVNPSAQFAPKFNDDEHRTRSRRPILRKVREYIELLQPERGYPDFDTATQRSAGFLERVRFNSNIINVDSAWSSEVGDFGWQIPLWNREAARERPQVYPMPGVAFVSTAEGDGEKPTVAQDCRDTDMLFFFADFKTGTSDTDQWKPYLGLDYANLPHAKAIADIADARSMKDPKLGVGYESEGRRRAVSRFLPGVRRFTWRLAPAAQKAALNAGRAGKPVYVGLDSVSFMRAGHLDAAHKVFPPDSPLESALKIDPTGASKPELTGLKYWSADGAGAGIDGAAEMSGLIAKFVENINDPAAVTDAMAKLTDLWNNRLKNNLAGMTHGNLDKLKTVGSGISRAALCQKLKDDAVGQIKRKEMLVTSALRDWLTDIDGKLESGQQILEVVTKDKIIKDLVKRAQDHVRPLFKEASQDIAQIGEGVEKVRAILVDVEVEIDLVIARARQRVDQFNAGYDRDKPWSPDRRKAFREGVEACIAGVVSDIEAAIDEAAQRLATELGNASQSLAGHVAKFLKEVAVVETGTLGELSKVGRLLDPADRALKALQSEASDIEGKIPELIAKVQADTELAKHPELLKSVLDLLTAATAAVKAGHAQLSKARDVAHALDELVDDSLGGVEGFIHNLATELKTLADATVASIDGYAKIATQLSAAGFNALKGDLEDVAAVILQDVGAVIAEVDNRLTRFGNDVDAVVLPATYWLDTTLARANAALKAIPARMSPIVDDIAGALQTVKDSLGPDKLFENIVAELIRAALEAVLDPIPATIDPKVSEQVLIVRKRLQFLVDELVRRLRAVSATALGALDEVTAACDAVNQGVAEVEDYLEGLKSDAKAYLEGKFGPAFDKLKTIYDEYENNAADAKKLLDAVKTFDRTVRGLHNDLGRLQETAEAYAGRVLDAAGKLDDGGLLAVPNNVLKLYSAVTSAPELAALKADIDRIRSAFDELGDVIETTKANALFDRLSDELKAIGLSLPFDKIGDNLIPANLRDLDIGAVFRNFGGTKLDKLFKGYRIPEGVSDAVKVTHDFDKKQARAWVQVDINAPFPGRRSLFSLGVFKADFIDMQLTGRVRLEASKDQQKVSVTGFGRVGTTIDAVVAGQSMVKFEKFGLAFTKEKGLDVEFDPKNVRLNPQFKFIQDFLSSMYPELPGGLEWIRDNGMPVGVEHNFAIPNLSLTFGTSGVSNISLENHFRLIAFPDFLLANRFNLSTVERPFIFSIFIIGGTGYIQIEAEYKPVRDELSVLVEAAAGGSAQLAFAFGPFTGQVFITLSGVLSYRKTIGKAGGGLSISVVLVIAGHVDVAGIVTVGITLMLRMTYRDSGQIDADGSLTVTIRISKFFKLTARAQVKYKLRGGNSETSTSVSTSAEVDPEVAKKAAKLEETAKKVQGAMK